MFKTRRPVAGCGALVLALVLFVSAAQREKISPHQKRSGRYFSAYQYSLKKAMKAYYFEIQQNFLIRPPRARHEREMADDEIDDLVLEGHGGVIQHAGHEDDPNASRREALEARLKCEVIRVAEEAAKGKGCRISPHVAQCLTELTMSYADHLAEDLHAFAQHRKGKVITHEDVLLAVRRLPAVKESVHALLPSDLKRKRQTTLVNNIGGG